MSEGRGPAAQAAGGLRARKKAATRSSLRAAAVRLAREQGPDTVTVEDICAAVDVAPRTFFNYFAAKDEALFDLGPEETAAVAGAVADRPGSEEPLAAVAAVLAELIDTTAGSGVWHQQLLLLREYPALVARLQAATRVMEGALAEGIAARTGRVVTDGYVATVAAMGMTAFRLALTRWLDSPDGTDARTLFDPVIAHLGRGLAVPESADERPESEGRRA